MENLNSRPSSLRAVLHVVFKRKILILLFFSGTVALTAIGTLLTQPVFMASAQMLVRFDRDTRYALPGADKTQVVGATEQVNSEIELLKSRTLIDKLIEHYGANGIYTGLDYREAVLRLTKALEIERIKGTNVISVSYRHTDPKLAANLLNRHAQYYLEHHVAIHKNPQSYAFFEEQSKNLENRLKASQKSLERFKRQNQVTDLAEEQKLLLQQIANLRTEMNLTASSVAETATQIEQIRQQVRQTPQTISQSEEVDHNPAMISNFETKLIDLQLRETQLSNKYTAENRMVQDVREEIKMVQDKLNELRTKRYGVSRTGINATHQRLRETLLTRQAEQKAIVSKQATQKGQMAGLQEKLKRLNQLEIELNQLQQTVDIDRRNYKLYLSKFEEARISDALDSKKITNVSLLEPARTPLKPVHPKVLLNLLFGFFTGILGAIGCTFILEYLDDSLESPEDVERILQVPLLASVPEMRGKTT